MYLVLFNILYLYNKIKQIEIMTHIEKIQKENLESLKGQLNYTNDCLMNRINEMDDWEVKEFVQLNADYNIEIFELENHIKKVF